MHSTLTHIYNHTHILIIINIGVLFGTILLLGIWRYFHFSHQKKQAVLSAKAGHNPLAHRIDH